MILWALLVSDFSLRDLLNHTCWPLILVVVEYPLQNIHLVRLPYFFHFKCNYTKPSRFNWEKQSERTWKMLTKMTIIILLMQIMLNEMFVWFFPWSQYSCWDKKPVLYFGAICSICCDKRTFSTCTNIMDVEEHGLHGRLLSYSYPCKRKRKY